MAYKRKLDTSEDSYPVNTKQIKLIPFPSATNDDVAMSESPVYDFEAYHSRLCSTASSVSSSSLSTSPVGNPMMDLYPEVNTDPASSPSIGLLQPNGSMTSLKHASCTQIPKLKMACSAGPHGQRTMFALCEQCGSIEMLD
ncbi:hypothetical protein BJ322DRAFT_98212 [Thelephora terrestris]|uniref:Uncharacterized protein n=1 Tax=Thelephora terrestris TaxID=56493 RepID=A0A9P6LCT3_9AGAM|nr:hypothetical protein BJ322DRAFT_98212 [Thelephora terrestris]